MTLHTPFRIARPRAAAPRTPGAVFFGTLKAWRTHLFLGMLLLAGIAHAQGRGGPGGGGPGGGGPGGGMMGGSGRTGFAGDRGASPSGDRTQARSGPHLSLPGRWWDDGKTVKRIGIRSDQQRRMDEIFEANKGNLLNLLGNLQREETHLTSMSPAELQDENKVFTAIDRVSQSRADLEKATAHTMMQIRQQMDTAQLTMLDREIATTK